MCQAAGSHLAIHPLDQLLPVGYSVIHDRLGEEIELGSKERGQGFVGVDAYDGAMVVFCECAVARLRVVARLFSHGVLLLGFI